jgi:hypothetical protein
MAKLPVKGGPVGSPVGNGAGEIGGLDVIKRAYLA